MATPEQLLQALQAVIDPNTGKDFVTTKQLKNLQVSGGEVSFDVELGYPAKSQIPALRQSGQLGFQLRSCKALTRLLPQQLLERPPGHVAHFQREDRTAASAKCP